MEYIVDRIMKKWELLVLWGLFTLSEHLGLGQWEFEECKCKELTSPHLTRSVTLQHTRVRWKAQEIKKMVTLCTLFFFWKNSTIVNFLLFRVSYSFWLPWWPLIYLKINSCAIIILKISENKITFFYIF